MSTIGLAMIARNGAATMRRALDPFKGLVDEVVIVLGGASDDNTAEIAGEYGRVLPFAGPVDDTGALLDFAAARQAATDALSTEWMLVVDCDDVWTAPHWLREVVSRADEIGAVMVYVPYAMKRVFLYMPRLYRCDSGKWEAPIHEFWSATDKRAKALQTDFISVHQERPDSAVAARQRQNILIAERYLEAHGPNARTLALLCQDYLLAGYLNRVIEAGDKYLTGQPNSDDELFQVRFWRAMAWLHLDRPQEAHSEAVKALMVRNFAMGWTLLADTLVQMSQVAKAPAAVLEMAALFADKALTLGKPRTMFPYSPEHITTAPMLIKAKSLGLLGRIPEALAALDLAQLAGAEPDEVNVLRQEITYYAKAG